MLPHVQSAAVTRKSHPLRYHEGSSNPLITHGGVRREGASGVGKTKQTKVYPMHCDG